MMRSSGGKRSRGMVALSTAILAIAQTPTVWAGPEHTDFEVGQDGTDVHMLLMEGDEDILSGIEPIELLPLDDPFSTLDGWYVAGEPGWEGLEEDEPDEGLFALLPDHEIALHRVAFDDGFSMFDEGENPILGVDGANYVFASGAEGGFHEDLLFAADPSTPFGTEFFATFSLTDLAGFHADSEQFTLRFLTIPEPGTMALLGIPALIAMRRRTRA